MNFHHLPQIVIKLKQYLIDILQQPDTSHKLCTCRIRGHVHTAVE